MHHISKNLALVLLTGNFQRTPLDSLKFETSSVTILTFVTREGGDNDDGDNGWSPTIKASSV